MKLGLTFSVQSNSHIQELQIQTNYFSILKEVLSCCCPAESGVYAVRTGSVLTTLRIWRQV